ncbi:hypothetical protein [Microscilla marina]|uniref:Cell envelope biogenesis protein OmpA n=1 Tax=Microscilla marina ATCC 23134 TaxID=313606 RepID=A1ZMS7_MICM2|nr:hypothetical protein [Microscilla marina]EAY28457.1 hypothetical protein M23134_04020 [Microscilla marina ATCC 23134]
MDDVLKKLKEILLEEDRKTQEKITRKVDDLQNNIDELRNENLKPVIEKTVRTELKESKDALIEAIYPLIGKLIRKFVQVEFEKLSENVDKQLDRTFSVQNIRKQLIALWEGISHKDLIIKELIPPVVEEVFVIDQESGILHGKYSHNNTIDQDVIAGMLTAIKSFIEDAFQQKTGSLDMIEYGTFKIMIQNSYKFYLTAIVSGSVNTKYKTQLLDYLELFAEQNLTQSLDNLSETDISEKLKTYFDQFNATNK